ncbi:MAG: hypothetical protein WA763_12395 [Pseudolabrys sp.]
MPDIQMTRRLTRWNLGGSWRILRGKRERLHRRQPNEMVRSLLSHLDTLIG